MADLQTCPNKNHLAKLVDWYRRHPYGFLVLLTTLTLAPFLAKPFSMDDPCYLWAAKQIQAHPTNPYGFNVNWVGSTQPMWQVTQNPPLLSYYLAVAALIFGWSEIGMHLACLLPAIAVVLGTFRLAKNFCRWPLLAALATLFAPDFLVSSTTIMCDVAMLAFWVWAVVYWTEGLRQNIYFKLAAAGTLAGMALLTKYNGASVIPLLAAYGLLEKRSVGRWALYLLIPVAAFFTYEWLTLHCYGQGLFSAAAHYARSEQSIFGTSKLLAGLNALTFTGGCFAAALFCAPFLWRQGMLTLFAAGAGLFMALTLAGGIMAKNYGWITGNIGLGVVETQMLIWTTGGVSVLALAVADVQRNRTADAGLLALWVLGTIAFAAFFNWTVNGRSLLAMAPAVGTLIARRLEQNRQTQPAGIKYCILASAALALLVAQADYQMASANRKGAEQVCTKYANLPGRVWFEGHWGFQYYMQAFGAWPLDVNHLEVKPGDFLIIPEKNPNTAAPDSRISTRVDTFALPIFPGLATMSLEAGAGFYFSRWGPLPFAFGNIPPENLSAYAIQ